MNGRLLLRAAWSLLALLSPLALAAMPPSIDGETGVLHVYGSLTESPCRLEMDSAWQAVSLGNTASARLQKAGDEGAPVAFVLRLRDCRALAARSRDERSGNLLWSRSQPAVAVRFIAAADDDSPQLMAVRGVSGMALRLRDARGRDVSPGRRGRAVLLVPGQDTLRYTLSAERTRAPLRAGAWHVLINVGMEYD